MILLGLLRETASIMNWAKLCVKWFMKFHQTAISWSTQHFSLTSPVNCSFVHWEALGHFILFEIACTIVWVVRYQMPRRLTGTATDLLSFFCGVGDRVRQQLRTAMSLLDTIAVNSHCCLMSGYTAENTYLIALANVSTRCAVTSQNCLTVI